MKLLHKILILVSFLLLSFLSLLTSMILRPGSSYRVEYDVRVINGFRDNSSMPLVIWCTSSDGDDMGGRALQEGDDYRWSAVVTELWGYNVAGPHHFQCTMKRDAIRKTFDVFEIGTESVRCGSARKCSWLVKEDGFYFSNDEVAVPVSAYQTNIVSSKVEGLPATSVAVSFNLHYTDAPNTINRIE